MISDKKSIFDEPKILITGVEGAGKTLFAIQQSALLSREDGGELYQLNIRGADPAHLPKLPFSISDMATNEDGSALIDPETGDHMPKWATLPSGSVIIVDEAHKVFPQRGPGRPPKWIEMMGEGRQAGIRFVLLSQAPASIDGFVRDRISVHYHLERKGGMKRATVIQFDHCISYPKSAYHERKEAQVHFWSFPLSDEPGKDYKNWYKSAKSHHFKLKLPWKIFAALLFLPAAGYVAYQVWDKVGGVMEGVSTSPASSAAAPAAGVPRSPRQERGQGSERAMEVVTDPDKYRLQFKPIVPEMPWSAPAYQAREVVVEPEVYCMSGGHDGQDSCRCITEQGTPYSMSDDNCRYVARYGNYNPFRPPVDGSRSSDERGGVESAERPDRGRGASPDRATSSIIEASNTRDRQLYSPGGASGVVVGSP